MILFNSSTFGHFKIGHLDISGFNKAIKSLTSGKALMGLARRIKAHREMRKLQRLDNRMLKDIGLERSDLTKSD